MCVSIVFMGNILNHRTKTPKSEPLSLLNSDVCGPMPTLSLGGASYFVTFMDDYSSQKVWVYPLKRKDDVFSVFHNSGKSI